MGFKNNLLSWILIGGIGAGGAFVGYYLGSRGNAKESQEIKVEAQGLEDRIKEYFDACLNLNDEKILELFGYQRFVEEYKKEIQNSKYGLKLLPIIRNLTLYVGYTTFLGFPPIHDIEGKIIACKQSPLLSNVYRTILRLADQNVLPSETPSESINEAGIEAILAGNVFVHIKNAIVNEGDINLFVEELYTKKVDRDDDSILSSFKNLPKKFENLTKELEIIKETIQKYRDKISLKVRDCKIYPYTFYLRKPFVEEKGKNITENIGLVKVEVCFPEKLKKELGDRLTKLHGSLLPRFDYSPSFCFRELHWRFNTFRQGYIFIQDEKGRWNIFGSSIDLRGLLRLNWRELELPYNLLNLLCSRASSSPNSYKLYLNNRGRVFNWIVRDNLFWAYPYRYIK
ncbi:hypothetical protein DRJ19_01330 [Candidatus Woesearchaeota archaeon]|nr:MAG: hypothetical protein DRJ19_01330 [Candidatus Woesearchaeota archaeon]